MNIKDKLAYGRRVFFKSGPPLQLTFFITSRCNLRCQHCFYWKELDSDHSHELRIDEIENIAQSLPRLLVLSLTGGEPFVRRDIKEIYDTFVKFTRPHIVTISTNGYYRDRMNDMIPQMLEKYPKTNFYIYLSIDGPEEVNDKIRGKNTYQKAMEALDMLQPYRQKFKNFGVSISMTCNSMNQDALPDFFRQLTDSKKIDNINIGLVRGDPKNPMTKQVELEKYREITSIKVNAVESKDLLYFGFLLKNLVAAKDYYTYKIVSEVVEKDHYVLPCYAGTLMAILYDNGDVFPCEILADAKLGNIRDFNYQLPKLWSTPQAEAMRRRIIDGHCYCTFECAMSSNVLFNPKYLAKSIIRSVRKG